MSDSKLNIMASDYEKMDMLRFTTAGSVDDGKSTLIGRLLYDSKSIFEDQMEAIEKTSRSSGEEEVNLALLTDGLKAEREQKITIDVAYRYFATPRRKFIIADTPGHTQYTRNMVTGASTADLAIILVDASKGLLTQSRRHAFISTLLRIPHLVVAVNKMDLVEYDEQTFSAIKEDFRNFAKKLDVGEVTFIPISALKGDNVVDKSENMPWYQGSTLLYHLEQVEVDTGHNAIDFRLPVQYVIRPNQDFRGFSGRIASGRIKPGDEVMVLPSKTTTKVKDIVTRDQNLPRAQYGDSITLTMEDEVDISRGDMIVRRNNVPTQSQHIDAYLCWMNEEALEPGKNYLLQHTSQVVSMQVETIHYRMNVDTLSQEDTPSLALNEIGRVQITTSKALFIDPYKINKITGSFIVIDPASNVTVGAGIIRKQAEAQPTKQTVSPNVVWEPWNIPREQREERNGHPAKVLWFTGPSGSGKTTIAQALEQKLWADYKQTMLLDGDQVRHGLCGDLGFSPADRAENIRRVGHLAKLFYEHGNIVLCSFVSPYAKDRDAVKALFPEADFVELYVQSSMETRQQRDPKGLYAKAKSGEISGIHGYDLAFEEPASPDFVLNTDENNPQELVQKVFEGIFG